MKALQRLYRRLDLMQRTMWFRIVASVIALTMCGIAFGRLLVVSHSLAEQRRSMVEALVDEDRNREAAASLRSNGTIQIGNRTYGDASWARLADRYVDPETGVIVAVGPLIEDLIADQKPTWAPPFLLQQPNTTMLLGAVFAGWLLLIVWLGLTLTFILVSVGTMVAMLPALALGSERWMLAAAGMGTLSFTYVLLSRAVMVLYQPRWQPLAVAHTVLKEASRLRISVVFIVLLLAVLPLLPMRLDPASPLRFRLQTFISNSLTLTFAIAAVMTLVLSCATVAFEIRDRQIWQLVTKPLSRLGYLLGKWIGVMSVNVVILAVCGVSIFMYIQYLRVQPVAAGLEGQLDRMTVQNEVLTARASARPEYEGLTNEQLRQRVEEIIKSDPDMARRLSRNEVTIGDRVRIAGELQKDYLRSLRSIPPGQYRTYVFKGLGPARERNAMLTLRFRFLIGMNYEQQRYDAAFMFNEDPRLQMRVTYVPTITRTITMGPEVISDEGTLSVSILNITAPPEVGREPETLHFEEKDLELLYVAGDFEGNFLRAVLMMGIKLAFLAILGIACATFLNFPVACLLAFTMFMAGSIGPYLVFSLQEYYPTPTAQVDFGDIGMVIGWVFQNVIRFLAQCIVTVFGSYGFYSPTNDLVEGRLISWQAVLNVAGQVGVLWSGVALFTGYLIFRRRELAIYSGHG